MPLLEHAMVVFDRGLELGRLGGKRLVACDILVRLDSWRHHDEPRVPLRWRVKSPRLFQGQIAVITGALELCGRLGVADEVERQNFVRQTQRRLLIWLE